MKKLNVKIGDLVEIGGRRYDVVSDKAGGVALEPAVTTTVEELRAEDGGRPLNQEEFDELFGDLLATTRAETEPTDGGDHVRRCRGMGANNVPRASH